MWCLVLYVQHLEQPLALSRCLYMLLNECVLSFNSHTGPERQVHYPHFTDETTEAHRGQAMGPRSAHSR